ncbi:hypothetical protein DP117_07520 [Brasilonema sp. UFV-L1]|nr:hypothetical protein [Brasilonema sp. UFV-L1]
MIANEKCEFRRIMLNIFSCKPPNGKIQRKKFQAEHPDIKTLISPLGFLKGVDFLCSLVVFGTSYLVKQIFRFSKRSSCKEKS